MTKQELRSCPFCGGKASLIDLGYRDKPHRAIIRCDERYFSKCFLPESCYIAEGNEDIEQLINKWNTRASDAELDKLRKIEKSPILEITESDLRDYEKKEFEKYYAKFSDLELVVHLMADLLRFGAFKEGEKDPGYLFSCEIQALRVIAAIAKKNPEFSCNGWIINYLDKFGFLEQNI